MTPLRLVHNGILARYSRKGTRGKRRYLPFTINLPTHQLLANPQTLVFVNNVLHTEHQTFAVRRISSLQEQHLTYKKKDLLLSFYQNKQCNSSYEWSTQDGYYSVSDGHCVDQETASCCVSNLSGMLTRVIGLHLLCVMELYMLKKK